MRILTWLAALACVGMYLSILLAVCNIGPHIMGGERVIAHGMVTHRCAACCRYWNSYGVHCLRICDSKTWSRHFVIAIFVLIILYASVFGALNLIHRAIMFLALNLIHRAIMWRAIINASVFGGASAWYFYFKPNVAAYFRELREPMT